MGKTVVGRWLDVVYYDDSSCTPAVTSLKKWGDRAGYGFVNKLELDFTPRFRRTTPLPSVYIIFIFFRCNCVTVTKVRTKFWTDISVREDIKL